MDIPERFPRHGRVLAGFALLVLLAACGKGQDADGGGAAPSQATAGPAPAEQVTTPAQPTAPDAPASAPQPAAPATPVAAAPAVPPAPAEPPAPAGPVQHVINGVVTQWRPMILFAQPGDQIVFRQMAGHDTESMEGLMPEGAKGWKSQLGAEGYSITLDVPGAYIYKCNPHVSTGMVGAIVVGAVPPGNLDALRASPQNKGMIGRAIRKLGQAIEAR